MSLGVIILCIVLVTGVWALIKIPAEAIIVEVVVGVIGLIVWSAIKAGPVGLVASFFAIIVAIVVFASFFASPSTPSPSTPSSPPVTTDRYSPPETGDRVYFIRAQNSGLIKIGHSIQPEKRLKQLQTGSGDHLEILSTIPGGSSKEAALHRQFASLNHRGEWFEPDPELLHYINKTHS